MATIKDLIKALEDLTQSVNKQNTSPSGSGSDEDKLEKSIFQFVAFSNLINQIGGLGDRVVKLLQPVTNMEQSLVRVGFTFDEGMKNLISGTLPLGGRMQSSMALLETGLERNSLALGQTVARSAVLGENIQMLTGSFRDLKLSFALNRSDLDSMSQVIERSAYTYKTSTTELTKEMASLAQKIAVMGMSGAMESNEAIIEALAMTQRTSPGVLQGVLGDLLSTGTGGLGQSLFRGLEGLASDLVTNQITDPNQIFAPLKAMIDRIESTLGPITGDNFRVQTDLLQGMFGFTFEQVMAIKSMLENTTVLTEQQKDMIQRSKEINELITNLGPKLKEPLEILGVRLLKLIDDNKDRFTTFFSVLVGSSFAAILFSSLGSIAAAITALRFGNAFNSIPIIGAAFSIAAGAGVYSYLNKELQTTQQQQLAEAEIAANELREMNERERRREAAESLMSAQRELQQMTIGSIGRILAATQGASLLDQSALQTRLTAELLEEMKKANTTFEKANERPAPSLPEPSRVMRH